MDHGAQGDGKTDDRAAIQAAIDAVDKAGGGTVDFPAGVYAVTAPHKANWRPQIRLCKNLTLRGVGMSKSVIRIADDQGAYDVVFGANVIEGFSILDLTVDGNGSSNPVVATEDSVASPYHHMLFHLPNAKAVSIQRCRFTNLSGVWAIFMPERAEHAVIDSCLFDNIGGFTSNDWDHSCIYIKGFGPCVVSNNVITSRFGSGTTGARTAVEVHGSNHKLINNRISGFRYGVNVCSGGDGKNTEPSVHQYYIGNTFVNVGCGFAIWGIGNRWFDNLVFERNDITIDVTGWKRFFPEYYGIGVVSYRGVEPPKRIENLRIADNHITYLNTEGGTPRSFGMRFDFAIYTDRWSENPPGQMTNVEILRNTISGAYSSGIDLNCVAKNMEIAGNTLIDPGRGVGSKELKCGVRLRNSLENVRVLNNAFYNHQAEAITCGIYDLGNNLGGGLLTNNRISGTAAADLPMYLAAPTRSGADWDAN